MAPPVIVHTPLRPYYQIQRDIELLESDNARLELDRRQTVANADYAYNSCMAMRNPSVKCVYRDEDIREIDRQISKNNREIDRLQKELRRY